MALSTDERMLYVFLHHSGQETPIIMVSNPNDGSAIYAKMIEQKNNPGFLPYDVNLIRAGTVSINTNKLLILGER